MRWIACCLVAVAACPSSHSATLTQAANFNQIALAASAAVTQYQGAAAGAANHTECTTALQQYVNTTEPLLEQMRSLAAPMDAFMKQVAIVYLADSLGSCLGSMDGVPSSRRVAARNRLGPGARMAMRASG